MLIIIFVRPEKNGKDIAPRPAELNLTIIDDESAGIEIYAGDLVVYEAGGEAAYAVKLSSQPLEHVTVHVHAELGHGGHQQLIYSPENLTFTNETWNDTQTVRLSAVDDDVDEGNNHSVRVWHTTQSADPMYAGDSASGVLNVSIADDDTAMVAVSPLHLIVHEGEADMFAAAAVSAACGSIFDDDGIPYAFCGGRCAPASLCTDAATALSTSLSLLPLGRTWSLASSSSCTRSLFAN